MTTQKIDALNKGAVHPYISRKISMTGLIVSCLIILAGIFLMAYSMYLTDMLFNTLVVVLGGALLLWGIFRLFRRSSKAVYIPTGSTIREETYFFDLKHLDTLKELCLSDTLPSDAGLKSDMNGNIRLDIIQSGDSRFAAVQLFQFVPYSFNPVTSMRYYTDERASHVCKFLQDSIRK